MDRAGLPGTIKIAIGFLIADVLWCISSLLLIGPLLVSGLGLVLIPLSATGLLIAFGCIGGLLRRERWAPGFGIGLTGVCSGLLVWLFAAQIHQSWDLKDSGILSGGIACFLTPHFLLWAGRRAYLALDRLP